MKLLKTSIFVALIAITSHTSAQTSELKNNISIGGGKQSYNGDLGNSWFQLDEEWYGFVAVHYNRYLNKSFDASLSVMHGDYGRCREADEPQFRPDGSEVLNMLSRLTAGVLSVKYKFANGYLMKEDAKFAPYVFVGAGINNISNHWWADKTRVNPGNFTSINGGAGLRYNFCKNFNFTYNVGIGRFTKDDLDFRKSHDMYLQNTFLIGMNFWQNRQQKR